MRKLLLNIAYLFMLPWFVSFHTNAYCQTRFDKIKIEIKPVKCYGIKKDMNTFIPPPENFKKGLKSVNEYNANIEVTYNGFSPEAKEAFQYAVNIWKTLIHSPVTIRIEANWKSLDEGVLGSCGASSYCMNFSAAPERGKWYPVALAEKILRRDINGTADPDMVANFNSDETSWYYGTDGDTPSGQFDLASTVLHEICHGLGFIGNMNVNDIDEGTWGGGSNYSLIFDKFIENGAGQQLIDTSIFPNPSVELYEQYTSNSLFFNSPIAIDQNNDNLPKLYAPSVWNEGSSIYHLDDATYPAGDTNSLMTHATNTAEAIHDPGPITLGIFAEIGWIHTYIDHDTIKDIENLDNPITAIAIITSDTSVLDSSTYIYYSFDIFENTDSVLMEPTGNTNEYSGVIPVYSLEQRVYYYISIIDTFQRTYTSPVGAPENFHSFYVGDDIIAPSFISHSPIPFIYVSADTVLISADVTDNIDIDTVYVEYFINNFEQTPFGLSHDTLNKYTGNFIFEADVLNIDDSISYRIVAVDVSQNANLSYYPSDGYYYFMVKDIPNYVEAYENDFNSPTEDFLGSDYTVETPIGFADGALHSKHPYESPDADDQFIESITQLSIPVKLKEDDAYMKFDEIVLVEPGETGSNFGDEDFWDYVIVEGSKDEGTTWIPLEPGYDCRRYSIWETRYNSEIINGNSTTVGNSSLYKSHLINLFGNGDFSGGDEILIRFRLYADPYACGWGWAIDNLKIQGDVSGQENILLNKKYINIYPNPSFGTFTIEIQFNKPVSEVCVSVLNILGKQIFVKNYANSDRYFNKQINLNKFPAGLYFVNIQTGNESIIRKIFFTK